MFLEFLDRPHRDALKIVFFWERYHIGIQAGWENHMFFNQNQFIRFTDSNAQASFFANQGDLTLQGFSARVRFDF